MRFPRSSFILPCSRVKALLLMHAVQAPVAIQRLVSTYHHTQMAIPFVAQQHLFVQFDARHFQ